MKVILTENVASLGNVGEIVNVSPGHARNFLIPRNWAVLADETNKKELEDQKRRLAKKMEETKNAAVELKSKINGLELEFFRRVAGNGKLFGAVSNNDVSKALEEKGFEVEKRLISFPVPAKSTGTFDVVVDLFQDVKAEMKVRVEMDLKQAEDIRRKQELAAKKKSEKAEAADAGEEATEASAETPKTEEQKLDEETNRILRD